MHDYGTFMLCIHVSVIHVGMCAMTVENIPCPMTLSTGSLAGPAVRLVASGYRTASTFTTFFYFIFAEPSCQPPKSLSCHLAASGSTEKVKETSPCAHTHVWGNAMRTMARHQPNPTNRVSRSEGGEGGLMPPAVSRAPLP